MDPLKRVLEGTSVTATGGGLALSTCLRHLQDLGAECADIGVESDPSGGEVVVRPGRGRPLEAVLAWRPGSRQPDSEATMQASCGLMEVHGRRIGRPARLGLEVASVAAGVLTSHAILAGLLSKMRGGDVERVETSVLQAGLVFVSHYLAGATADDSEEWGTAEEGPEPGPPFSTADGHRFEMEALDGDTWKAFWELLGLSGPHVGRAWMAYLPRYRTATCRLPAGFHAATARRTLAEIVQVADAAGVSISRLRSFPQAVADLVAGDMEAGGRLRPPWRIQPLETGTPRETSGRKGEGLPLAGLRVVEVARRLQGPLAGLLLRMLGAEVIRIEPPGG
ncbi:MAG: CoA transferase, partial [Actinomycetota bacterium]|nr:CoA transferase [Actinomycetota bacterium]